MKINIIAVVFFLCYSLLPKVGNSQNILIGSAKTDPILQFDFENTVSSKSENSFEVSGKNISFVNGFDGKALRLEADDSKNRIALSGQIQEFNPNKDFTVSFWVKMGSDSKKPSVLLSNKEFNNKSLADQKKSGWVFYVSEGTWAWNIGTGDRRLTHECEIEGESSMPINGEKWHQLAMSYDHEKAEVRLFYDGEQKAVYNVNDIAGFDFSSSSPLMIGSNGSDAGSMSEVEKEIGKGAEKLQELVDQFNQLGLGKLAANQFESLIVDPKGLFKQLVSELAIQKGTDSVKFLEAMELVNLEPIMKTRAELMKNPYTIHQVRDFMSVAPLLKIYSLDDDKVIIKQNVAESFVAKEKLFPSAFDMDKVAVWGRTLSPREVSASYASYFKPNIPRLKNKLTSIKAGVWNIHHGGKHNSIEKDGWDSRLRIIEMLQKENVDVIMMQETYSSGAFIADQLGYYFASTVDRDGLNQGTNISVLSRYPIKEIYVPKDATFMNVGVKVAISQTQELYVMSNWYGMAQFPAVFDFHQSRFLESDSIPTIFAGDFNAVPPTDGGESLAAEKMIGAGFTDAYRSLYPNVKEYPGYTHQNNRRIDQLYYKGSALRNSTTKVISEWPTGFPSDHYLIVSEFKLTN